MPSPIALTDEQLDQIMQLSRPLQPHQRAMFLEMLAAKLNGRRGEVGDGWLYQVLRELQRQHFSYPQFGSDTDGSKYTRRRRHGASKYA